MKRYCQPREWKKRSDDLTDIEEQIELLVSQSGLSPVTLRVCVQRGIDTSEKIKEYLSPSLQSLKDPFSIQDMDLAVERLSLAKEQKDFIRIYGDYDVDGTTSVALLTWFFRDLEFEFDGVQPDRFKDGYGLNVPAIEKAHQDGVKVLVTVDCGITNHEAAQRAKDLGIDVIIVDHHQVDPQKGIPVATAVVNPHRKDCQSGLKELCGCGLAFYLCIALRSFGRKQGWFENKKEPNLKEHLDLVVIATAADLVPLVGDNRTLVRQGMEVLKRTKKPGVNALMEVAGLAFRSVSPGHLGFVLGPRINASGRMGSASLALNLLTSQDFIAAVELAHQIEKVNQERIATQNEIWDEVRLRVEKGIDDGKFKHAVVVADQNWHEGVVGIVASKVTETFQKPAIIISLREDFGKASVRSYGGKNVLEGLRACDSYLKAYGGHAYAAGLSIDFENVDPFIEAFDKAMGEIVSIKEQLLLWTEGECKLSDFDLKTLHELESLGPFGPGNPEPVFTLEASVKSKQILKERHLKMQLSHQGKTVEAIWFHAAERKDFLSEISQKQASFWAGVPELNRFRGKVTPTFRVRDWRA